NIGARRKIRDASSVRHLSPIRPSRSGIQADLSISFDVRPWRLIIGPAKQRRSDTSCWSGSGDLNRIPLTRVIVLIVTRIDAYAQTVQLWTKYGIICGQNLSYI